MSETDFDDFYDPLATPNPAYDDDTEPAPARLSSWERRGLAHALLARARARQDAIADAFVDAILDGKISLFRLLIDLEQAAVAGETEADEARLPTLAEILIPMLDRERKQAAASRETPPEPESGPESGPTPCAPRLAAPAADPEHPAAPAPATLPGLTNLHAAAETPSPTAHHPRHCRMPSARRSHLCAAPCRQFPRGHQRSSSPHPQTGNAPKTPLQAPASLANSPSG